MTRTVAFVMGAPHSGTTLLTLILGSHSRGFALGEMEGLPGAIRERPGRDAFCMVCEEEACPIWNRGFAGDFLARRFGRKPGLRNPRALLARAARFGRGFYEELFDTTGAEILVDSSKSPAWLATRLGERRDWRRADPALVVISRDGRAAVNSWLRKFPDTPAEDFAARWVRQVKRLKAAFAGFDPARRALVRYEDLAADPEPVAARLCAVIGIGFEPAMVRYWAHEHHLFKANAGTLSLIARHRVETGQATTEVELAGGREAHYARLGRTIRPDERWRTEMSDEHLAIFEKIAGETNRAYASEEPPTGMRGHPARIPPAGRD